MPPWTGQAWQTYHNFIYFWSISNFIHIMNVDLSRFALFYEAHVLSILSWNLDRGSWKYVSMTKYVNIHHLNSQWPGPVMPKFIQGPISTHPILHGMLCYKTWFFQPGCLTGVWLNIHQEPLPLTWINFNISISIYQLLFFIVYASFKKTLGDIF